MQYLQAEQTLAEAEALAWRQRDWDSLARLYMPLQEARRQRRQRCGEGPVRREIAVGGPAETIDAEKRVAELRQGSLILAGWGSIEPALAARRAQQKLGVYVDVLLAAVYPVGAGRVVAIVPREDVAVPAVAAMSIDQLTARLPAQTLLLGEAEAAGISSFEAVMETWEKLHAPFLASADATRDPVSRIEAYRRTIAVNYACELAHQRLSDTARSLRATQIS